MGAHIVRRGVAGNGTRPSEPRPTAVLSKEAVQRLLRDHGVVEHAGDAPMTLPSASSPRLLAHTLRREPTPDGMPAASRPSSAPLAPLVDRTDISTIAMPRIERTSSTDAIPPLERLASDTEHTRQLRSRVAPCADVAVPPAAEHFEADLAFSAAPEREPVASAMAEPPRIDRALAHTLAGSRQVATPRRPRAPAGRMLRVLPITLAILVAAGAAYLMLHSGL